MNRLRRAWRSLGRARQLATSVLCLLCVLQACLLVVVGHAAFIPAVAVAGLLGLVVIKQSAATRESLTRLTTGNNEMLRTHKAMQRRLSDIERAQQNSGRALSLLREHVGRTGAQFDWLADRSLEAQSHLAELEQRAGAMTVAIAEQYSLVEATREAVAELTVAYPAAVDETERRVAGVVTPMHDHVAKALAVLDRRLELAFDGGNSHSLERRIVAEISALSVLAGSRSGAALPPFEGWSMAPLAVRYSESVGLTMNPDETIVELGSGVSTAWIAYALSQKADRPRFVSIDHDSAFADATVQSLARLGLENVAEVVTAPLESSTVGDEKRQWYRQSWISDVANIGLLIVDGPPAGKSHAARYPALPLLIDRLADQAVILVDDADRPGESEMISQWTKLTGVQRVGMVGRSMVLKFTRTEESSK